MTWKFVTTSPSSRVEREAAAGRPRGGRASSAPARSTAPPCRRRRPRSPSAAVAADRARSAAARPARALPPAAAPGRDQRAPSRPARLADRAHDRAPAAAAPSRGVGTARRELLGLDAEGVGELRAPPPRAPRSRGSARGCSSESRSSTSLPSRSFSSPFSATGAVTPLALDEHALVGSLVVQLEARRRSPFGSWRAGRRRRGARGAARSPPRCRW